MVYLNNKHIKNKQSEFSEAEIKQIVSEFIDDKVMKKIFDDLSYQQKMK